MIRLPLQHRTLFILLLIDIFKLHGVSTSKDIVELSSDLLLDRAVGVAYNKIVDIIEEKNFMKAVKTINKFIKEHPKLDRAVSTSR